MKKNVLALLFWVLALDMIHAAILHLNNNTNSPAQYTTFTAAQTAAASGDTIMVHGSPFSYGSISISKSLTIIGPGHKPNKFPSITAEFGYVTFISNILGIKIYGIKMNQLNFGNNNDDVIIENVYCTSAISVSGECSNIQIRGSVIEYYITLASDADNILVEYNYFSIANSTGAIYSWGGPGQKVVQHNIFAGAGSVPLINGDGIRNTLFVNNIFYGVAANSGTQVDCVYNNNLSFGHTSNNTLPPTGQAGANNLVNVNPQIVNIQAPNTAPTFSYSRNYRLQPGSPAIGSGFGGKDIGLYTPGFEFSMTGEPQRPQTILLTLEPITLPFGGSGTLNFTGRKSTVKAQ
jgi:hypothetical protein